MTAWKKDLEYSFTMYLEKRHKFQLTITQTIRVNCLSQLPDLSGFLPTCEYCVLTPDMLDRFHEKPGPILARNNLYTITAHRFNDAQVGRR